MENSDPRLTLQMAVGILELARSTPAGGRYSAGFESLPLLRSIHALAGMMIGQSQARLVVSAAGADGFRRAYDLGWSGGRFSTDALPEGTFPLGGLPPPDGRCVCVSLEGGCPADAKVMVEVFEDGLRHGCTAELPAIARTGPNGIACGYACRGVDVAEFVEKPPVFAREAASRMHALSNAAESPDRRHPELVTMLELAESRGEAVSLLCAGTPGVALARAPGTRSYRIVPREDLALLAASWAVNGKAHVAARLGGGCDGRESIFVRKVAGLVDGAADIPGVCVSVLPPGGVCPSVKCLRFTGGSRAGPIHPSDADRLRC